MRGQLVKSAKHCPRWLKKTDDGESMTTSLDFRRTAHSCLADRLALPHNREDGRRRYASRAQGQGHPPQPVRREYLTSSRELDLERCGASVRWRGYYKYPGYLALLLTAVVRQLPMIKKRGLTIGRCGEDRRGDDPLVGNPEQNLRRRI